MQCCHYSTQILDELISNGLSDLQAFRLTNDLRALKDNIGRLLDVIKAFVDFLVFVAFQSSNAAIQDIHVFAQFTADALHCEAVVIS
jgi:hypothetical protein